MTVIIVTALFAVAVYCAVAWGYSFYEVHDLHKNGALNVVTEERYNLRMYQLGLCGILAAGFAGLLIK